MKSAFGPTTPPQDSLGAAEISSLFDSSLEQEARRRSGKSLHLKAGNDVLRETLLIGKLTAVRTSPCEFSSDGFACQVAPSSNQEPLEKQDRFSKGSNNRQSEGKKIDYTTVIKNSLKVGFSYWGRPGTSSRPGDRRARTIAEPPKLVLFTSASTLHAHSHTLFPPN